ncbi:hypothetical protein GB937_006009 [Aspergillus fischeri]|nr:hypothetical protein GB937_006009 [Aspergillus fischeri]
MPLQRLDALPTEIILSITTHLTSHKDRFVFPNALAVCLISYTHGDQCPVLKKHVHSKELPTIDDKLAAEIHELVNYYNGWATWKKELRHRDNYDAWVALLLYILPNLRTMEWLWVSRTRYAAKLVDEVILRPDQFEGSGPLGKLEKVLLKGTG